MSFNGSLYGSMCQCVAFTFKKCESVMCESVTWLTKLSFYDQNI